MIAPPGGFRGAWAIRLRRPVLGIPRGWVCLAEIDGSRVRIASDWLADGWVELEARLGDDYVVVPGTTRW